MVPIQFVIPHLLVAGLLAFPALGSSPGDTKVGEKDTGKTLHMEVGGALIVRLPAQLGTGYGWHVHAPLPAFLEQQGEPKIEPQIPKEEKVGGFEHQVFHFKARASGTGDLQLDYSRHWEAGSKVSRTVIYHVAVHEKGAGKT